MNKSAGPYGPRQQIAGPVLSEWGQGLPVDHSLPPMTGLYSEKAVFLDKDGTLIEDIPYNVDPDLIRWAPGALEGLRLLHSAGYRLIVITNQSGVAHGYFAEAALDGVEAKLRHLLAEVGLPLAGFYYCPHHPHGALPDYTVTCRCRKPEPGLILQAAQEHGIDCAQSWFIGDILNDVEAGRHAGCQTILLANGGETEWILSPQRLPHYITTDLAEAARIITKESVDRTYPGRPYDSASGATKMKEFPVSGARHKE